MTDYLTIPQPDGKPILWEYCRPTENNEAVVTIPQPDGKSVIARCPPPTEDGENVIAVPQPDGKYVLCGKCESTRCRYNNKTAYIGYEESSVPEGGDYIEDIAELNSWMSANPNSTVMVNGTIYIDTALYPSSQIKFLGVNSARFIKNDDSIDTIVTTYGQERECLVFEDINFHVIKPYTGSTAVNHTILNDISGITGEAEYEQDDYIRFINCSFSSTAGDNIDNPAVFNTLNTVEFYNSDFTAIEDGAPNRALTVGGGNNTRYVECDFSGLYAADSLFIAGGSYYSGYTNTNYIECDFSNIHAGNNLSISGSVIDNCNFSGFTSGWGNTDGDTNLEISGGTIINQSLNLRALDAEGGNNINVDFNYCIDSNLTIRGGDGTAGDGGDAYFGYWYNGIRHANTAYKINSYLSGTGGDGADGSLHYGRYNGGTGAYFTNWYTQPEYNVGSTVYGKGGDGGNGGANTVNNPGHGGHGGNGHTVAGVGGAGGSNPPIPTAIWDIKDGGDGGNGGNSVDGVGGLEEMEGLEQTNITTPWVRTTVGVIAEEVETVEAVEAV